MTEPELNPRFERVYKTSVAAHLEDLDFIEERGPFWIDQAFGLDRVDAFRRLPIEAQQEVLTGCGDDLLREACFIEMAGMRYTARMSLLARNLQEQIFYSLMGSEEAKHFCMLRPYTTQTNLNRGPDAFTGLIGEIIESADREHAIFLVQVLLEGWGLNHFSWMAKTCQSARLQVTLRNILRDEGRHHACGLALATRLITRDDYQVIVWLKELLQMVRVGPLRLLNALTDRMDSCSTRERVEILSQLDAESATKEKLDYLKRVLASQLNAKVMANLEGEGFFEPA